MRILKNALLGLALATSTFGASAPASAQYYGDRYHHNRHRGNDAAVAIGAGVVGLALGAAIASSSNRDRYYDRGYRDDRAYYYDRPYYRHYHYRDYPRYDGYYRHPRHYRHRQCYTQRIWDDWRERYVRIKRCR